MRRGLLVALAALVPALTGFSAVSTFDLPADAGGGGGYAFTGAPSSHGMTCVVCHRPETHTAPSTSLFVHTTTPLEGRYVPGQIYEFVVHLVGETRGLERNGACAPGLAGCNRNGMIAEITDAYGQPLGTLCPDGVAFDADGVCAAGSGTRTALLASTSAVGGQSLAAPRVCGGDGPQDRCIDLDALRAAGKSDEEITELLRAEVHGSTVWSFQWRAPDTLVPGARLWIAAVDGDGGTRLDPRYADSVGDVAVSASYPLSPEAETSGGGAATGCAGAGGADVAAVAALLAALLADPRRRYHRRSGGIE